MWVVIEEEGVDGVFAYGVDANGAICEYREGDCDRSYWLLVLVLWLRVPLGLWYAFLVEILFLYVWWFWPWGRLWMPLGWGCM